MKTRKVKPYGWLLTHQRAYFLIAPQPIQSDSWELDGFTRWAVVPADYPHVTEQSVIYPFARHIVTNCATIEFDPSLSEIEVQIYEDRYDIDEINKELQLAEEEDEVPF